jgi:hypothetical protein
MATTTNYGWTTPDDTALVKDGAAAIRTLGSSVDTTTKALNPETTLGDLAYRSSTANVKTRLPIGTTGQVLTVTGGLPVWSSLAGGSFTLLSTTTCSGTSTTVSSISQSYKNLFIEVYGIAWDTNEASVAFNTNLTSALSSLAIKPNNVVSYTAPATDVTMNDGVQNVKRDGANNYWNFTFYNYASTTDYKAFQVYGCYEGHDVANRAGRIINVTGGINSDTAVDSFTFKPSTSSNMTSGTIKVYGVN